MFLYTSSLFSLIYHVCRLDMLRALSDNGKNLLDFEEEMGPFLMLWMPDVISYGK